MDRVKAKHILVTGGGAPGAAGIIRALRQDPDLRISSCDIRPDVLGRVWADDFFVVPAGDSPSYIQALLEACAAKGIDTVLPITTKELLPISTADAVLRNAGVHPLVSPMDALRIANDKCALHRHLYQAGIPCPTANTVTTPSELESAIAPYERSGEAFVIKPCIGNGSRAVRIVDPSWDSWKHYLNDKPNSLHISIDQLRELFKDRSFGPFMVMDYLDGPEYSVDCLMDRGRIVFVIPRSRLKINNGISVAGQIERNEAVIELAESVLQSLDLHGPVGIQIKYSGNRPYVLEMNPRLQGTSSACLQAGINPPLLALDLHRGKKLIRKEVESNIRWGTHFVRYYSEETLP